MPDFQLNRRARDQVENALPRLSELNGELHVVGGARIIDLGVHAKGSLEAGALLSRAGLADFGVVESSVDQLKGRPCLKVVVRLANPTIGCLLAQYAGWKISVGKFFAMASGPIRALAAKEPLFEKLGYRESADIAVGILETSRLPDESVVYHIAQAVGLRGDQIILLVARTASVAGSFQVVARSVETCLHKLFELGFDVTTIYAAAGAAWLPPIPKDDLTAIGRTNDAILYGGDVILWIDGQDERMAQVGPKVPACASPDYGQPFADIFRRYGGDFYAIDPMLFSPARVVVNFPAAGTCRVYGRLDEDILVHSFFAKTA
jgi:methenyltetrahydromethanopterin cyclohydrolase